MTAATDQVDEGKLSQNILYFARALRDAGLRVGPASVVEAVQAGDFDTYYARNLAFHQVFLILSGNRSLLRQVENAKHRLYDFPRRSQFLPEWELASTKEHAAFLQLLEAGDLRGAADYLRDVHWSFEVQQPFILQYYFPEMDLIEAEGA